jgi:hypothetical protein
MSSCWLVAAVLAVGLLYLRLHHLPEHIAHKSSKLQYEIVAVLCLLALFTHAHLFWVAALLLAFIDIPNFGGTNRLRGSPASRQTRERPRCRTSTHHRRKASYLAS